MMIGIQKVLAMAVLAGIVNSGTAIIAVIMDGQLQTLGEIAQTTWVVIFVGFAVSVAKDLLATFKQEA